MLVSRVQRGISCKKKKSVSFAYPESDPFPIFLPVHASSLQSLIRLPNAWDPDLIVVKQLKKRREKVVRCHALLFRGKDRSGTE